jgi:hypothetical protein
MGFLLFATASRPTLGPTQVHIQWVPGILTLGVKRPGREVDHLPPSTAEVKNVCGAIPPLPLGRRLVEQERLHGVVLSETQRQI